MDGSMNSWFRPHAVELTFWNDPRTNDLSWSEWNNQFIWELEPQLIHYCTAGLNARTWAVITLALRIKNSQLILKPMTLDPQNDLPSSGFRWLLDEHARQLGDNIPSGAVAGRSQIQIDPVQNRVY